MALWQSYLTKKLIYENHPALENERCLNTLQTKHTCTICKDICPNHVFKEDQNWELCNNCGICTVACPARCIAPSSITASKFIEVYQNAENTIVISCADHSAEADYSVPCLGSLSWEALSLLALKCKVFLNTAPCTDCDKNCNLDLLKETLTKTAIFLGNSECGKQIEIISDNRILPTRQYSRRDAFSVFSAKSKTMAGNLLPDIKTLLPNGLFWMQLLTHHTKQKDDKTYHMQLPSFSESCTACGICTKLCPGQALHRLQYEEYENQWFMALIPWRCSNCGLCVRICPSNGMQSSSIVEISNLNKPLVHQVNAISCIRCGEPIINSTSGLCNKCSAETPATFTF